MADLFQPYCFNNGVCLKNRLVLAPMTLWSSSPQGEVKPEELAFLASRSQGAAMVITAAAFVLPEGKAFEGQPEIHWQWLEHLRLWAKSIQSQGAKAILQLHHGGQRALVNQQGQIFNVNQLTTSQIERIIHAFAQATKIALVAGFDGVEIMGANGFLLQQFVSRQTNQRQDQWGEPFAFVQAVCQAVITQAQEKPEFIVGYRFSPEEAGEQGLTMVETLNLVEQLAQLPLQYVHISLWDFFKKVRRGADTNAYRIALVHQQLNGRLPLIGVGNLTHIHKIQRAFATGWAEFVAIGKAALLNPDWVARIATEQPLQSELDPQQADHYGLPSGLWQKCLQGASYLPVIKGQESAAKFEQLY